MPPRDWASELTAYAESKLAQNLAQIARCTVMLTPAELWHRASQTCNSVGNLLLHLEGNVRQWILGGVGGQPVTRDRPAEFSARGGPSGAELLAKLEGTTRAACELLRNRGPNELLEHRLIQGYDVSELVAVTHVVEHFSFHTGQIVHMTKALRGVDLSQYDAQGRNVQPGLP